MALKMLHGHQLRLGALLQIWGGFIDPILQVKEQIGLERSKTCILFKKLLSSPL